MLDVDLAGEDGLALIPALRRCAPCEVVVLTSLSDPAVAAHALRLGAQACVHKTAPAEELLASLLRIERPVALPQALTAIHPQVGGGAMSQALGSKRP